MYVIVATVGGKEVAAITSQNKNQGFSRMRAILGTLASIANISVA